MWGTYAHIICSVDVEGNRPQVLHNIKLSMNITNAV
jgi:hypothetical protein